MQSKGRGRWGESVAVVRCTDGGREGWAREGSALKMGGGIWAVVGGAAPFYPPAPLFSPALAMIAEPTIRFGGGGGFGGGGAGGSW